MWSTGCMAKIQANLLFGASPIRKKTTTSWHPVLWFLYVFLKVIYLFPFHLLTPGISVNLGIGPPRCNGADEHLLCGLTEAFRCACELRRGMVRPLAERTGQVLGWSKNNHGSPWIYDTCLYCSRFLWYISQMYLQMFIYIVNIRSMCINVHIYLILPVEEYTYSASDAAESRVWVW